MKIKKKFVVRPSRLAACTKIAGDVVAGQLFYRIFLRHEMMKAMRDSEGQRCVVLTRIEWMIDTGLTRHQYDRSIRILKKKKIIKVRHKKLRKMDKYQRTWIYLSPDSISATTEIMQGVGISIATEIAEPMQSDAPEESALAVSVGADDNINEENKIENEEATDINVVSKKHDVIVSLKKEKESIESKKKTYCHLLSDSEIENVICKTYESIGAPAPTITAKLRKDTRQCLVRLELAGCRLILGSDPFDCSEDGYGIAALLIIASEWVEYCVFVKIARGGWNMPYRFNVPYLQLHIDGAIDYLKFKDWFCARSADSSHLVFGSDHMDEENRESVCKFYELPWHYDLYT